MNDNDEREVRFEEEMIDVPADEIDQEDRIEEEMLADPAGESDQEERMIADPVDETDQEERIEEEMIADPAEESVQEEKMDWQPEAQNLEMGEKGLLPWLKNGEADDLQSRWNSIQISFVDDPRASVKKADELLSEAVEWVEQAFTAQRTALDEKWTNQPDASTEDLRIALQGYRSFLNRLLAM